MRFGRILLAILAPLLSVSPALKADVTPESHAPAIDSLLNLLRSVAPAATAADTGLSHVTPEAPVGYPLCSDSLPALHSGSASPEAQAALRLLLRRQQRTLLRC